MKKLVLLLFGILLTSDFAFADGGWATSAVYIKLSDSTAYYKLNDEGWTDGSWGNSTAFDALDFGTPDTLILKGAAGNAWTDDSPGYDDTSFKLYYRVYKSVDSPGDWTTVDLTNSAYDSGNNKIYDKTDAEINILDSATAEGTNEYTLEVVMSKNQFYAGGNWNSMVPGGQGTAYDSNTSGYKATFTKTVKSDYSGAVVAPTTAIVSVDSIALNAVEGYEYAVVAAGGDTSGLVFQDDTVFKGLAVNSSFDFYQRVKETSTTNASGLSEKLTVNTPVATQLQDVKASGFEVVVNQKSIRLAMTSEQYQNANVSLISLSGKIQSSRNYSLVAGENTLDLPQTLDKGIYLVALQIGDTRLVKKVAIR